MRILSIPLVAGLIAACVALFLFAELAEEVLEGDTQRFDYWVRAAAHRTASPALTRVMLALTFLGSVAFVSATSILSALLLWLLGRRRRAVLVAVGFAGASVLMLVLKLYFRRPRPQPFFGLDLPTTYSFPSGHALVSFCVYGILAAFATRHLTSRFWRIVIWALAVALILGIGLSRIYLGVHYPSDVVAGYLAATVWTVTITVAYRKMDRTPVSPRL